MAEHTGTMGLALGAWVIGGVISLLGALCYAELAATYPHAGGDYHFLTRAFGRWSAFLFAWARLTVIQSGAIALLAFVLGDYATELWSLGPGHRRSTRRWPCPAHRHQRPRRPRRHDDAERAHDPRGRRHLFIALGRLVAAPAAPAAATAAPAVAPGMFGLVMVFVLLTYGGWSEAAFLSGELRDPGRTMVRALVYSLALVTGLYLVVNWAFLTVLGISASPAPRRWPWTSVSGRSGPAAPGSIAALIVVAALTSINAAIFTGARSSYAVGRDFRGVRPPRALAPDHGTPVNALVVQGAIALALIGLAAHAATASGPWWTTRRPCSGSSCC